MRRLICVRICKMIEEQVREHYFAQEDEEEAVAPEESADAGKDA